MVAAVTPIVARSKQKRATAGFLAAAQACGDIVLLEYFVYGARSMGMDSIQNSPVL
jgi:hypothetical protein